VFSGHRVVTLDFISIVYQGDHALVMFVTAGYPRKDDTVSILLAMQAGGADIIEVGVPFSDPIADGPAIQETNLVRMFGRALSAHHI